MWVWVYAAVVCKFSNLISFDVIHSVLYGMAMRFLAGEHAFDDLVIKMRINCIRGLNFKICAHNIE